MAAPTPIPRLVAWRRLLTFSLALAATTAVAGCSGSLPPLPEWEPVPLPPMDQVESVVLLFGDPGRSVYRRAPVIEEAAREVEEWSSRLGRDSAVAVVFLGDLVYPKGLHPVDHPDYPRDSIYVQAEIDIVDGPAAHAHNTVAYFIAGNHDWGEARGVEGARRLRNLEEFLDRARERWDVHVRLVPPAGEPGPEIVDMGDHFRLILFDSAWWLLAGSDERKQELLWGIERAMADAGGRAVMLAAHHPWQTAGPHGGNVGFWKAFGVRGFLNKTGSLLQDINSRPMRDLRVRLEHAFARVGPPLIYVGGHDHSLQVIEGVTAADPDWILVSGTGVKVTEVGHVPGMRFRAAKAGYMSLVTLRDGSSIVYVRGADEDWITCPNDHYGDAEECMAAAPAAFETLFSMRIPPPE